MSKFCYLILLLIGCNGNPIIKHLKTTEKNGLSTIQSTYILEDTVAGVEVTIVQEFVDSSNHSSTILMLPGWNFERHRWLNETELKKLAKERRFRLILPEMRGSIYASHFYPESTIAALNEKTGKWLIDTFVPAIQKKYHLLLPFAANFVFGLSTGGRGALYCAWKRPDIFLGAASLSGDFNQSKMQKDFLFRSVYGDFQKNKDRWINDDNLYSISALINQPVYIAHGREDNIVAFEQSADFYAKIKETNPSAISHFVAGAGHTFSYWHTEVAPVLEFFDKINLPLRKKN